MKRPRSLPNASVVSRVALDTLRRTQVSEFAVEDTKEIYGAHSENIATYDPGLGYANVASTVNILNDIVPSKRRSHSVLQSYLVIELTTWIGNAFIETELSPHFPILIHFYVVLDKHPDGSEPLVNWLNNFTIDPFAGTNPILSNDDDRYIVLRKKKIEMRGTTNIFQQGAFTLETDVVEYIGDIKSKTFVIPLHGLKSDFAEDYEGDNSACLTNQIFCFAITNWSGYLLTTPPAPVKYALNYRLLYSDI